MKKILDWAVLAHDVLVVAVQQYPRTALYTIVVLAVVLVL